MQPEMIGNGYVWQWTTKALIINYLTSAVTSFELQTHIHFSLPEIGFTSPNKKRTCSIWGCTKKSKSPQCQNSWEMDVHSIINQHHFEMLTHNRLSLPSVIYLIKLWFSIVTPSIMFILRSYPVIPLKNVIFRFYIVMVVYQRVKEGNGNLAAFINRRVLVRRRQSDAAEGDMVSDAASLESDLESRQETFNSSNMIYTYVYEYR